MRKKPPADSVVLKVKEIHASLKLTAQVGGFESVAAEYGETIVPDGQNPDACATALKQRITDKVMDILSFNVADLDLPKTGKSTAGQIAFSAKEWE